MARTAIARQPPDSSPSKAQAAYQWIKDRIFEGRYSAGYRLVLSEVAKQMNVSVVPVREAIRLLEAEGLVTFERNVGAQVAMLEPAEYVYTMQTLALLEGAATSLAAPYIDANAIARAHDLNQRMKACVKNFDPHRFTELNFEFHQVLFERCPNPHVLDLVYRGWNRLRVLRDSIFSFVPGRARQSVDDHATLLRLIETRAAPLEIEFAARAHRTATLEAFLALQAERKVDSPLQAKSTTRKQRTHE